MFQQFNFSFMLTLKQFPPPTRPYIIHPRSSAFTISFLSLGTKEIRTKTTVYAFSSNESSTIPLFPFLSSVIKEKEGNRSTQLGAGHKHHENNHSLVNSRSRPLDSDSSISPHPQERKRFQHQHHLSPNQNLSSTTIPQLHPAPVSHELHPPPVHRGNNLPLLAHLSSRCTPQRSLLEQTTRHPRL